MAKMYDCQMTNIKRSKGGHDTSGDEIKKFMENMH